MPQSAASTTAEKISWRQRRREDIAALMREDPAMCSPADVRAYSSPIRALWAHRRQHWLWMHGFRRLAMRLSRHTRNRYGIEIHPGATIGRRVVIDHGVGIVIGETAVIGNDCLIYHGVTLGGTGKHIGKRHPTVGDGCMIGAHAVLLGPITVGDGSKIGASAVVLQDIPAFSTAVGHPAHVCNTHEAPANWTFSSQASQELAEKELSGAGPKPRPADVDAGVSVSLG